MDECDFTSLYAWLKDDPRTNEPKLTRGEVPDQLKPLYEKIVFSQVGDNPFRVTEDLLYFYELGFIHEYTWNVWRLCKYLYPHRHMLKRDKWELLFIGIKRGLSGHIIYSMAKHLARKSTPPIAMSLIVTGLSDTALELNRKRRFAYIAELFAMAVFQIPLRHKEIESFCLLYRKCCPHMAFKSAVSGRIEEMGDTLSQIVSANYQLNHGEAIDLTGTTSFTVLRNTLDLLDTQLQDKKRIQDKEKYQDRIWNEEFVTIVKEAGWYLPTNMAELEKRGKEHHNCIGGYYSHFFPYHLENKSIRIVMNKENEAEIVINNGTVGISQCKTKHNKKGDATGLKDICNWMSRNLDKINCTMVSSDTNNL